MKQKKDIPIIDVRDLPVGDFQVMTDDEAMKYIQTNAEWKHDPYPMEEYIKNNKKRAEELDDLKHNYKALEEFYNNSVAYATKIQAELNSSKEAITYLEGEIARREQRILGLQYEVSKVRETTKPIRSSSIPNIPDKLRGLTVCEHCHTQIFDQRNHKPYNYCAGCGRKVSKE